VLVSPQETKESILTENGSTKGKQSLEEETTSDGRIGCQKEFGCIGTSWCQITFY
jgi:hypothetical protein